nr:hypothetical protein [Leptospira interrogans]
MNFKRSKNHFPEQILAISYDEIQNSLGREFSILSSWCKKEYGKFTQFLNSGNLKKAKETGSFYFSQRRFYQSIKGGKKRYKSRRICWRFVFVGHSFKRL